MAIPCGIAQAFLPAAVAERHRRIVAVHRDCERAGGLGGPAGSATGVSGHDVGDIRRPRCGRSQGRPIQQRGKRGRRESVRPARAYCSRPMPSAWVVLVGSRRARLMIRRRVHVERDLSLTGASHLGWRLGGCSHRPIAWRSPGIGQSGCRDRLARTCDAVVNLM
jgi:hypothetical protein